MISQSELEKFVNDGLKLREITSIIGCCEATIRNYLKKWNIKTSKGFYSTGKIVGRPKGIKQPLETIEQMRLRNKGESNPFYGKNHTKSTKEKMSKNHADFNGDKNPYKKSLDINPNKREEARKRTKNMWDNMTEIELNKRKSAMSLATSNSEYHKNFSSLKCHKKGHIETTKAGRVFHRSSWEKEVAIYLDNNDSVISFSMEPFCISYTDTKNITRFTRPDFIVQGNKKTYLIEVKPTKLLKHRNNEQKIEAMKNYAINHHIQFMLFTETEITKIKDGIDVIKEFD